MKITAYFDQRSQGVWVNAVFIPHVVSRSHNQHPFVLYHRAWNQWFGRWASFIERRFMRVY